MGDGKSTRLCGDGKGFVMVSIVDTMSDAIGSIEFAADALEAPVGSHMRSVGRDMKEARLIVAELVSYTERLLGFTYGYGDPTAIAVADGLLDGARDAIAKARGEV